MGPDKISKKSGMSPGSLVYVGDEPTEPVIVSVMDYDSERLEEHAEIDIGSCSRYLQRDSVTWINITGLNDISVIEQVSGLAGGLNHLLLEDILNTRQRPKLDYFEDNLLIILRMIDAVPGSRQIEDEQVSLVIGRDYVISFQERAGDVFESVRERIRNSKGKTRRAGAEYLAYALMDVLVDNYFEVLEDIGEQIESLQDEVMDYPEPEIVQTIHLLKNQMISIRKAIWPVRDIMNNLLRIESNLMGPDIRPYIKDIHDHAIHVADTVESYRDILSGVLEIYLSSVSNRMNEVMKVLTVIATIFIPLTFLAGVYGMNFRYMPELEWRYAYPVFWLCIVAIAVAMLVWFRKRRWL